MNASCIHRWGVTAVAGGLLLASGVGPVLGADAENAKKDVAGLPEASLGPASAATQPTATWVVHRVNATAQRIARALVVPVGNKIFVQARFAAPDISIVNGVIVDDGAPF